ncbi:hypothetical protein GCM10018789_21430 [Streptomyces werraensis]|nr:hypothetical protein GCM10018789_21430 [Streptomyces werraensis]
MHGEAPHPGPGRPTAGARGVPDARRASAVKAEYGTRRPAPGRISDPDPRSPKMSTSQPDASRQSEDRATPDSLLHTRTGTEVSPEDLVLASGKDLTPQNIEWARRKLAEEGPSAMEKILP